MLKKSLIAIAVLAIALPAIAGDTKVHQPWPMTYVKQDVTIIDVILDVGYYIHVKNQDAIEISQAGDYYTYSGCNTSEVISNFNALLSGSVSSISPAGGKWSATFNGVGSLPVEPGSWMVDICVTGKELNLAALPGGAENVKVAELKVQVLPNF